MRNSNKTFTKFPPISVKNRMASLWRLDFTIPSPPEICIMPLFNVGSERWTLWGERGG